MTRLIEDYAVIGNCETMALVGRDGSIDWLCLPRFDSASCFSALLDGPDKGRWLIGAEAPDARVSRRYQDDTLILETTWETAEGAVSVTDFMGRREGVSDVIRVVRGLRGRVAMRTELIVRFEYGTTTPWAARHENGTLGFGAGPDRLILDAPVRLHGEDQSTVGRFEVSAGEELGFTLSWTPSYRAAPEPLVATEALARNQAFWAKWTAQFKPAGEWSSAVLRSLITLKGLAHWETGGIVAAATTSLPEKIGGPRNWDYRYCWLRDATFTLYALISAGFQEEALAWRQWLLRAVAGNPDDLQIMYGVAGERRLEERELANLAGFENSAPVRIGNAAAGQVQLDVYGEVLDAFYVARKAGMGDDAASWALETALLTHLEAIWDQPDDGIWEVRGGRKHFTHSKVMAWVAFDRAVRSIEEFGMEGPLERWRRLAQDIHAQVCEEGFDADRNTFVQSYGSTALDASLLLIPMVGFLPPSDPRVVGTLAAIEGDLLRDGLVLRYDTENRTDGLPPGEGSFLACSFWLADNYILQDRYDDAEALFKRLLAMRNDVGLLAEEYDVQAKRQLGNFPQAFSHLALVNTAHNLTAARGPVHLRSSDGANPADSR
ncbi:glycoside hydrolase family 15 protein [Caulobacter sp. S45]|uniref:glycoside hydrolase family 15 protein n=1 Tax=Caulobacter sp. S45 TaxID=1641861 RepID=UPI00131E41F8|nr:glycoside hydrolase family 15 protein [Caulobacter sp. S45]